LEFGQATVSSPAGTIDIEYGASQAHSGSTSSCTAAPPQCPYSRPHRGEDNFHGSGKMRDRQQSHQSQAEGKSQEYTEERDMHHL